MCLFPLDLVSFLNVGQRMMLHEVFTLLSPPKLFKGQRTRFQKQYGGQTSFRREWSFGKCYVFHISPELFIFQWCNLIEIAFSQIVDLKAELARKESQFKREKLGGEKILNRQPKVGSNVCIVVLPSLNLGKISAEPHTIVKKSVLPMAMYCFCHCFLYSRTEWIM